MKSNYFFLVPLLLSTTHAYPAKRSQTVIGGAPAGIYGKNATLYGPLSEGSVGLVKGTGVKASAEDVLLQNLLSAGQFHINISAFLC